MEIANRPGPLWSPKLQSEKAERLIVVPKGTVKMAPLEPFLLLLTRFRGRR
jgi:hypothetical protein